MQIVLYIDKLYHRFKQNVPESESRQFDRLRLRLLARCQNSGRLRLRLRLRLRTPGSNYPRSFSFAEVAYMSLAIVSGTGLPTDIILYVYTTCQHDDNVFKGKLAFTPLVTRLMLCRCFFCQRI